MKEHLKEDCMPKISENSSFKSQKQSTTTKKKKTKKKNKWLSMDIIPKQKRPFLRSEDFDHQLAEEVLEEIINSELAEEEKYDIFTKF